MKIKILAAAALIACAAFVSCDDTTDYIGNSLTDTGDLLNVATDTFPVKSTSISSGAVLSRNTTGYLGKIKDPETGVYITGNFMAQFNTLDNYEFPAKDSLVSYIENGNITADSCEIRLFHTSYYGDSLATMNLTAYEMATPMEENVKYYSDFDPEAHGLVRTTGDNIIKANKTYTLTDLSVSSDDRQDESSYTPNIRIRLNKPYTDKDGNTYNNYGTYIMKKYYEEGGSDNFKNSYNFIHNVCPGFYFKMNDGLGSMAYVNMSRLDVYFSYRSDSVLVGTSQFSGTEEVLQTTTISNDQQRIQELVSDNSCTYLKTPAGIFTELELPIEDIIRNHENDTINTAKIVLTRINNNTHGEYTLSTPQTLLMIPKDSLDTFFENEDIVDYKKSFIATFSQSNNNYTFNNISGMITYMAGIKNDDNKTEDWNKVVIVPVSVTTNSSGAIVKIVHDMSLTSTRLTRGTGNDDSDIKISVIYSKFHQDQ